MAADQTIRSARARELSWAVIGSSGFVGTGIVDALRKAGTSDIRTVSAPRLLEEVETGVEATVERLWSDPVILDAVEELVTSLNGVDIVVNAAGLAAPDSSESAELFGANTLLPIVIAEAANRAGGRKFLHISSAAVQGSRKVLDETPSVDPFSPYSKSKAWGEKSLRSWQEAQEQQLEATNKLTVVVIRATSVQGQGRRTSGVLQRVANSRVSSVAAPGTQPSVVSSLEGLSRYVVAVGSYKGPMPQILLQPWEGASVRHVLELAGNGRSPLVIPKWVARLGVGSLRFLAKINPRKKGLSRRLEVMWFGQDQVSGWAVDTGVVSQSKNYPSDSLRKALGSDD